MDQSPAATALLVNIIWIFYTALVTLAVTIVTAVYLLYRVVDEGESLLHWAAEGGHVTTMRLLIRRGCDVDSVDGSGLTPLHWAAAMGQTKAVRELIRMGATKSVVAGNCGTPLHQAALNGHVETVEAMSVEGCPIDVVDSNGATVLHFAAQGGHVEVIKVLVGRGCDVNAVSVDGCTPLHDAAGCGRTEAVCKLIKLGATKSVVAGNIGTPLHQAALKGHVETVEAMLAEGCPIDVVNSNGATVLHSAAVGGHVEVFKVLVGRGCDVNAVKGITDRDTHSVSTLEQCFVGGHASKLSQFCEACSIESSREGLRGALATLITSGLVDAHKVLCLCAISGDSVFLEDQFSELVTSEACAMPAAMKSAKYYFGEGGGVTFLNQLGIPDDIALYPLQLSLLSLKCFEMGFVIGGIRNGTTDHTLFITKLLSHPVFKETINENFPNGLSPLDLARQFELHDIAALIEGAGGGPGVWANIPPDVLSKHSTGLMSAYNVLSSVCKLNVGGQEVKEVFLSILGGQTIKEQVLGQRPDHGDVVTLVLPYIQGRHWKRVGLALGMKKSTLDGLGQQFPNDDDRYMETLSYWLEHGSSVTWKTLLDALGHSEVECTMVKLRGNIVSEVGGAHQVSVQWCVLSEGAVWCAVWRRQVLLSSCVLVFVLPPPPLLRR